MSDQSALDDALARRAGLPDDWRVLGYDSPSYIASPDSLYAAGDGSFRCVWPGCRERTDTAEAMFLHTHDRKAHPGPTPTETNDAG